MANTTHYSTTDAAISLMHGLDDLRELEKQRGRYQYELPYSLVEDIDKAAERVRDAVAFLASGEATED